MNKLFLTYSKLFSLQINECLPAGRAHRTSWSETRSLNDQIWSSSSTRSPLPTRHHQTLGFQDNCSLRKADVHWLAVLPFRSFLLIVPRDVCGYKVEGVVCINVRPCPCNIIGESVDCFAFDRGPVGSADVEEVRSEPSTNGFGNVCDEPHGKGGEQEVKVSLDGDCKHSRNRPELQCRGIAEPTHWEENRYVYILYPNIVMRKCGFAESNKLLRIFR